VKQQELDQPVRNGQPLEAMDGQTMKRLFEAAAASLEADADTINALNVFPVPDGDTGTNMVLTMRSALEAVAN